MNKATKNRFVAEWKTRLSLYKSGGKAAVEASEYCSENVSVRGVGVGSGGESERWWEWRKEEGLQVFETELEKERVYQESMKRFRDSEENTYYLYLSGKTGYLTKPHRILLHEICEEMGLLHHSEGGRSAKARVMFIRRHPFPLQPCYWDVHLGGWAAVDPHTLSEKTSSTEASTRSEGVTVDAQNTSHTAPQSVDSTRTLTVLSFNLLASSTSTQEERYDLYAVVRTGEREPHLLAFLRECGCDVIVLQEVTPHFHDVLLAQDWVRESYCISDWRQSAFIPIANLVLTHHSLPITAAYRLFHSKSPKTTAFVKVSVSPTVSLLVGGVHLKAGPPSDFDWLRESEVRDILYSARCLTHGPVLLAGDFNYREEEGEDPKEPTASGYVDSWTNLHTDDPGYTHDAKRNPLLRQIALAMKEDGSVEHRSRFDRLYLCSPPGYHGTCTSIELVGNEPISKDDPSLFLSDHFGLRATFTIRTIPA